MARESICNEQLGLAQHTLAHSILGPSCLNCTAFHTVFCDICINSSCIPECCALKWIDPIWCCSSISILAKRSQNAKSMFCLSSLPCKTNINSGKNVQLVFHSLTVGCCSVVVVVVVLVNAQAHTPLPITPCCWYKCEKEPLIDGLDFEVRRHVRAMLTKGSCATGWCNCRLYVNSK